MLRCIFFFFYFFFPLSSSSVFFFSQIALFAPSEGRDGLHLNRMFKFSFLEIGPLSPIFNNKAFSLAKCFPLSPRDLVLIATPGAALLKPPPLLLQWTLKPLFFFSFGAV